MDYWLKTCDLTRLWVMLGVDSFFGLYILARLLFSLQCNFSATRLEYPFQFYTSITISQLSASQTASAE
ncbi:hypothetical protein TSPI_07091 [Trichinella spiralis]|uniref:Uncharacterized protein n=1 Tax=Trichinella spiralis TaxID=6334 RepID=A0ABR3KG40_TRISP